MAKSLDSSLYYPIQANTLRIGQYALLHDKPCKIVQIVRSQPGKHGPAKLVFVGLDVFTGKKYEDCCPAKHMMKAPEMSKNEYEVISVSDEIVVIEKDGSFPEMQLPKNDIGKKMSNMFENEDQLKITVLNAMNQEAIVAVKKIKN
ncbi:DgyrCDS8192 [Dimorphilus gyrociliatus]|uniref:Eukaryotic translation initiation factor 5A n=1 Tax=Dimorphilus gyrociliatus TaxID=2664684 RepID=A0A7I8VVN9_9ANNE|nr:DgyrCDS8192 [Dimorphilus gyrociliatus]